jgi:hypothetical protein
MIDPNDVPDVADNELLARFILQSNETRNDGTVKPKLFLPYSRVELSVNRHREATSDETWQVGRDVAAARGKTLYGISNIRASNCRIEPLNVAANPILPSNPNHADIVGYPQKKEDQMSLATKLAAATEGNWVKAPSVPGDIG